MVFFGSLLDQFVSSFARSNVLLIIEFDADRFIDISTRFLMNRFNGLETFLLSLIYKSPRSRFMLMVIFVSIMNFKTRCLNSAASLFQW